jgi:hypothetical protein
VERFVTNNTDEGLIKKKPPMIWISFKNIDIAIHSLFRIKDIFMHLIKRERISFLLFQNSFSYLADGSDIYL